MIIVISMSRGSSIFSRGSEVAVVKVVQLREGGGMRTTPRPSLRMAL